MKLKNINRVIGFDPGSLVEAVNRCEHGTENESQRWFWKGLLQANKQLGVWKDYGEYKKLKRHQPWDNWQMKKPKYHAKNAQAIKINKTKVKMSKPVYFGLTLLDISKSTMYEYSYD